MRFNVLVAAVAAILLTPAAIPHALEVDEDTLTAYDIQELCESSRAEDQGICRVFFEGVLMGAEITKKQADGSRRICLTDKANIDSLYRLLAEQLEKDYRFGARPVFEGMAEAYVAEFPCN